MVSIRAAVMVITVLAACLLATNAATAYHGCCRSYMTGKIPFAKIKGYSVQDVTQLCHIPAIIFHTPRGRACTNPAHNWVMVYINLLRNKAQLVHIKTSQVQK
ncbi:C-C motif chemokine 5-like [Sebastes umbrosus]|uniref:C-C motif chemokine 5-like n=1 Tax=Sebastes umbrosus TaxID=72105 RepID=UPI00189D6101|nr:C-C motif chemokine 5-like [Sebastes umbrosus]